LLVAVPTLTVTAAYRADWSNPQTIPVKQLDSGFADLDLSIQLTEDGRLKGINATTTGQAEAITKSVVSAITTLGALGSAKTLDKAKDMAEACKLIGAWTNNKALTVNWRFPIDAKTKDGTVAPEQDVESKPLMDAIAGVLGPLTVSVKHSGLAKASTVDSSAASSSDLRLKLQRMGLVEIEATVQPPGSGKPQSIGSSSILVPLPDKPYEVAIPKAALFGTQALILELADSGALLKVAYKKMVGAAGAANALQNIANADSPATKAAELKAQADLLAQQQRLVLCLTSPKECK
jgi:hypothetical protein